jgi:putative inorganic carbon (HCO3(-)) transporter
MVTSLRRGPFGALASRDIGALAVLGLIGLALGAVGDGSITYVLIAAAFAVGMASPIASVSAICAAIPFIFHPVSIHGGRWSLLELSVGIAVCSVGLSAIFSAGRTRSFEPIRGLFRPWPLTLAAGLLAGAGALSLLTVADDRYFADSLREFRWVIVEPILALFLFRWALRRTGGRVAMLLAFLAVGTGVAISGGVQLVRGTGVVIADGVERATGPYPHPNNLALYLDRVSILFLAFAVGFPKWRRMLTPLAVVAGLGLAATLSRGAVLGYLGAAVFVALVTRTRPAWRWIAIGAATAAILIAAVGVNRITDRGSVGATSSRQLIWTSSVDMLKDHPLTGVGLDQFLYQYNRRYVAPSGWPERYTSHPHNILLDFWLSLGVAGLLAAAALAIVVLAGAWKRPRTGEERVIWLGCSAALIAGLIHGLVDNGYFLPDLAMTTWMLLAILESTRDGILAGARRAHD